MVEDLSLYLTLSLRSRRSIKPGASDSDRRARVSEVSCVSALSRASYSRSSRAPATQAISLLASNADSCKGVVVQLCPWSSFIFRCFKVISIPCYHTLLYTRIKLSHNHYALFKLQT